MYVMKDIAHRGCINSSEYPSPQAFSAQSFLGSTMSHDVSGILAENAFSRPLSPRLRADNVSSEIAFSAQIPWPGFKKWRDFKYFLT